MSDDSGRDLHLPAGGLPVAAAIVLHPHPAMGGDRHHPLVVAVAEGLAAASVAALRIDLSDPDGAVSAHRLEAVSAGLLTEIGVDQLVLVGYSWGSLVAATAAPAGLVAKVLVAPPVSTVELPRPTQRHEPRRRPTIGMRCVTPMEGRSTHPARVKAMHNVLEPDDRCSASSTTGRCSPS